MAKITKIFSKLGSGITYLFVTVAIVLPLLVTFDWMNSVVFGNDTRRVYTAKQINEFGSLQLPNTVAPFQEPLLSITFDDGWESVYSTAFPVMQKYSFSSTQYILGSEFDNATYMSEKQLKSLLSAGHEVASHTMSHPNLTELNSDELNWELSASFDTLSAKFGPVNDFASPEGAYNQETLDAISRRYRSQRNTAGDPASVGPEDVNLKDNFNRHNITAYAVRQSTSDQALVDLISYAQANNAWVVLVYHQVDDSGAYYGVSRQVFERQMQLIKNSQIKVAPLGQVVGATQEN